MKWMNKPVTMLDSMHPDTLPMGWSQKVLPGKVRRKYSNHVQGTCRGDLLSPVASSGNDSLPVLDQIGGTRGAIIMTSTLNQIENSGVISLTSIAGRMADLGMDSVFYFQPPQVPSKQTSGHRHKIDNRYRTILIPNLEAPVDETKGLSPFFLIGSWVILFYLPFAVKSGNQSVSPCSIGPSDLMPQVNIPSPFPQLSRKFLTWFGPSFPCAEVPPGVPW